LVATSVALAQYPTIRQTAEIHGQAFLPGHVPAPVGAMVLLERADSGVVANAQIDSNGKFEFRGLLPNTYLLRIRASGYEAYERYLDLTRETRAYVIAELTPLPGKDSKGLPPTGAGNEISARDAAIPGAAVKEFEKGKKLLVEDQAPEKSIQHLLKATQIYEPFPQAHVLLGAAYAQQGKWQESEQAFQRAARIDDKMTEAYVGLGTVQNQQHKFAEAERTLARAIELKPDSYQAQYELGKACWALRRNADAEAHAARALALAPEAAEAHLLMGNVLLRKGDSPGALREFKTYLQKAPQGLYASATRDVAEKIEKGLAESKK
jgi:tetratricopeptide (TPR) repeat protein